MRIGFISAVSTAALVLTSLPVFATSYNGTSTLAGPAGKSHHHRMHMKKKMHSKMMMKSGGSASENKQTPTGGQPGGGAGKS